jgi:hypothetical protein
MLAAKTIGGNAAARLAGAEGEKLRDRATMTFTDYQQKHGDGGKSPEQFLRKQAAAKEKLLALDKRANASFDLRNTAGANLFSKATGLNLNAGTNLPGMSAFSTDKTAGGYQAMIDRKTWKEHEKEEKFKKILGDKGDVQKIKDSIKEDEEDSKQIQNQIRDKENEIKNDPALKTLEDELKRIESAIRDEKDKTGTVSGISIQNRKQAENDVKNKRAELETTLKLKDKKDSQGNIVEKGLRSILEENQKRTTENYGKLKKAENGYAKDYMRNHIYLGGHHHPETGARANPMRELFTRGNLTTIGRSIAAQAGIGAAVAGPFGAIAGTISGALGGGRLSVIQGLLRSIDRGQGMRNWTQNQLSSLDSAIGAGGRLQLPDTEGTVIHNLAAGHAHAPHGHGTYHTPHGSWLAGLFGGGSHGGGGGGDHGHGGHDDHGHH